MYFIIFTAFILLLIWLFQYFFLANYYQSAKIRDIQQSARTIANNFDSEDMENITQRLAFENGLCILIADETGNKILLENNLGSFSVFNSDLNNNWGRFIFQLKNDLKKQKNDYITKIYQNGCVHKSGDFFLYYNKQ